MLKTPSVSGVTILAHSQRLLSLLTILFVSITLVARPARAQEAACFPETSQCIQGRFRQYWEQNGGLAIFGYPFTAAREELNRDTNRTFLTQWFERARFEWHPNNPEPYRVLLGLLGSEIVLDRAR